MAHALSPTTLPTCKPSQQPLSKPPANTRDGSHGAPFYTAPERHSEDASWPHELHTRNSRPTYPFIAVEKLLRQFQHLFADGIEDLDPNVQTQFAHHIKTETALLYRIPVVFGEKVHCEIRRTLYAGIIRHSHSPWGAPVLPLLKKDGKLRVCVDYRRLNQVTVKDQYPLPLIDDILGSFHGCTVFCTLDAFSGF